MEYNTDSHNTKRQREVFGFAQIDIDAEEKRDEFKRFLAIVIGLIVIPTVAFLIIN